MMGIIGCGNMGEALIKSTTKKSLIASDICPQRCSLIQDKYGVKAIRDNKELAKRCDLIILAVKPQNITEVLTQIKGALNKSKALLSIAAGITTCRIEDLINKEVSVVRAMPNTLGLIGKGITAVCGGRFAKKKDKKAAIKILSALGEVIEVEEAFMDVVTAISGSGPAYFFFLTEVLIKAGMEQGLKEETAKKLAVETALGAAELVKQTKEKPDVLRQKVTSKGGTTEAAFKVFEQAGLGKILQNGIAAAVSRSKELSTL